MDQCCFQLKYSKIYLCMCILNKKVSFLLLFVGPLALIAPSDPRRCLRKVYLLLRFALDNFHICENERMYFN